MIGYIGRYWLY